MRKIIVQILIVCTSLCAYAQIPTMPRSMLSPNAASLGEYGEVPVSPFTGIPQIEIPIYEIKVGDYSIPISMSYHAGGVRPDQHPGWTGLGWTLNAGGCISRVVNDMPDETNIPYDHSMNLYHVTNGGFYYWYDQLNFAWEDKNLLGQKLFGIASTTRAALTDTEPDEFHFNFCGYSGSFYMNESGGWSVKSEKPLKVTFDQSDGFTTKYSDRDSLFNRKMADNTNISTIGRSHSFKKFTIITEDGTQYVFGGDDNAIEYSMNFFDQGYASLMANTWNLTKIIYPNTTIANFTYERGDFIAQLYYSILMVTISTSAGFDLNYGNIEDGYEGQLILPSYLSKIEYLNARINFDRAVSTEKKYDFDRILLYASGRYRDAHKNEINNIYKGFLPILQYNGNYNEEKNYPNCLNALKWYKLTNIRVKDSKQNYVKSFFLEYNNNENERLMLKSIGQYTDISFEQGGKYKFEYYSPNLLPEYVVKQTDHWGFYNGISPTTITTFYNSREPNPTLATYGSLSKITYPAGGYSRFIYEPHDYAMAMGNDHTTISYSYTGNKIAGGLRIKSIINSATGNVNDEYDYKTYYYVSDYLMGSKSRSSGMLNRLIQYNFNNYTLNDIFGINNIKYDYFSTQSILPACSNSCGTHVGYNNVIEKNFDGSFTIYNYTNYANGNLDSPCDLSVQENLTPFNRYSSRSQERGLPYLIQEYNSNSNLKKKTMIEYERDGNGYVRSLKAIYTNVSSGYYTSYADGTAYRFYTYSMRKKKETECIYENGANPIETVSTYEYKYKLLNKVTKTGNNGEKHITTFDRPSPNGDLIHQYLFFMNHLSSIMGITKEVTFPSGVTNVLEKIKYDYRKYWYYPSKVEQAMGNNEYEVRQNYKYDKKWNPIYIVNDSIDKTVYVWGYNYQYLVAEVKNATIEDVTAIIGDIDTFSEILIPTVADFTKLNRLRSELPNAFVTTYQYRPMFGVSLKTDSKGVKTYYEYDYVARLTCIKDDSGNVIEAYKYNFRP